MPQTNYNERSWAIDLISRANVWLSNRDVIIKRVGGESTLKTDGGALFPDVLLFGSEMGGAILQGWELKMPDTDIRDNELIANALKKASALGLDSFLVWNVSYAELYRIEDGLPVSCRVWDDLSHIRSRDDVEDNLSAVYDLLYKILDDLNSLFSSGSLRANAIINALSGENLTNLLLQNIDSYAVALREEANKHYKFADEVTVWWLTSKLDYPGEDDQWKVLARNNLISLSNKFMFAHILRKFNQHANLVDSIDDSTTLYDALEIFETISKHANFWNIFNINTGENLVNAQSWQSFLSLNALLKDLHIDGVEMDFIHRLLDRLAKRAKRKAAGQFATPYPLAKLLVELALLDRDGVIIDPCCGTGTIARAAYDLKLERGVSLPSETVWASDKFALPLKMATLTMTEPSNIGEVLNLFKYDAVDLKTGEMISLRNPYDGSLVEKSLPVFDCVASNLPFVQGDTLSIINSGVDGINDWIVATLGKGAPTLAGRSDLYAYLPFYFWKLLNKGGRLGIIISNSWQSTEMGASFFDLLKRFYRVEIVVTSGNGRWFKNAKVVTNLVVLTKIDDPTQVVDQSIKFATLQVPLSGLDDESYGVIRAQLSHSTLKETKYLKYQIYNDGMLAKLNSLGLPLSAHFTELDWLINISEKAVKLASLFEIARGERRGWDDLFYPSDENEIEDQYLKTVLKTARSLKGLIAHEDGVAFCCEESEEALEVMGHAGALSWIRKFKTKTNGTGSSLPSVLARAGIEWYTMQSNSRADMVISMNPGNRMFVARFDQPTFVNQRLIRMTKKSAKVDLHLMHALLNSIMGLFYIEALGFGRGEGALDLNATKLKNNMFVLDPELLNNEQKTKILDAFKPILNRDVNNLDIELSSNDREVFDRIVLDAYGFESYYEKIKKSLEDLYKIRNAARD